MPLLGVELEPVLVSFGRFYDIFVIFFNYATFFGGATYFCHLSWGATFLHLFFCMRIFVIFFCRGLRPHC